MDHEAVLVDQTVRIKQGRIDRIGDSRSVATTDVDRVVDGRGRFLMPGLVDMHVHAWLPADLLQFLAYGVTSIRNMWGSPLQLAWRGQVAAGDRLGPTIYTAGPLTDGDPPIWTSSSVVRNGEQARLSVRAQKNQGYDFIKVYNHLSTESYEALIDESRKLDLPVVGHVPDSVGIDRVLEHRQASIEHLQGYLAGAVPAQVKEAVDAGTRPWWSAVGEVDESVFPSLAEKTRQAGVWNCVTEVVDRKFVEPKEAAAFLSRPEMRYASPFEVASWQDYPNDFRIQKLPPEAWAAGRRGGQLRMALIRALRDAGAGILLGSDTPNPFVVPGYSLHEELANLVSAGLTPFEALRAGTSDAAKFLGSSTEFGTVEEGKRADLLLVEGNPLLDVGCASRIEGTVVRGRWIPPAERSEMLDALVRSYGRSLGDLRHELPRVRDPPARLRGVFELRAARMETGVESWSSEPQSSVTNLDSVLISNNAPHLDRLRLHLVWDESGSVRTAEFVAERSEGTWNVQVETRNGATRCLGSGPGGWVIEPMATPSSRSVFLTPCYAGYLPIAQLVQSQSHVGIPSIPVVRFEFEPSFGFVKGTLEIREVRAGPGDPSDGPARATYTIEEKRSNGVTTGRLVIDRASRAVVLVEYTDQDGTKTATLAS
jgi:hypothetical protein